MTKGLEFNQRVLKLITKGLEALDKLESKHLLMGLDWKVLVVSKDGKISLHRDQLLH